MLMSQCGCGCGGCGSCSSCQSNKCCECKVVADGVSIIGNGTADGILRGYRIEPLDDHYVVTRPNGTMYTIHVGDQVAWNATESEITVTHPDGSVEVIPFPARHYAITETLVDVGNGFTDTLPTASVSGSMQEKVITNPSAVLPMKLLIVADGPTFRLSSDGIEVVAWAAWLDVYRNGTKLTPASSRIDGYTSLPIGTDPGFAVDYSGSGQNYIDEIPPGGSVTYGMRWELEKLQGTPQTIGVGHCRMSIFGSTSE